MIDSMRLLLSLVSLLVGLKLVALFFLSFGRKAKNLSLFLLEALLFLEVLETYLIIKGDIVNYPAFFMLPNFLHCLIGILPYWYIKKISREKSTQKDWLVFLWPVAFFFAYLPLYLSDTIVLLDRFYLGFFNSYNMTLEALSFSVAVFFTFRAIQISNSLLAKGYNHFSSYQFEKFKLFNLLLLTMIIFYFVCFTLPLLAMGSFYPIDFSFSISLVFFLLSVVLVVVALSRLPDFIVPSSETKAKKDEEKSSSQEKEKDPEESNGSGKKQQDEEDEEPKFEEYIPKLHSYIRTHKPYLNPNLKISDLANESKIPQYIITHVINTHMNKNFFEYVNDLRVEEFTKKLKDPENSSKTIMELALDSGFNSKSSFNSHFKKKLEMTPNQYRKQLKESSH